MNLSTGDSTEEQSVVETVEVVSGGGGERVLSPGGTETTLKILNPAQLTIPSSGIIEIDPQALSLVQMTGSNFDVSTVTPLSLAASQPSNLATSHTILSDMQQINKNKRPLQEQLTEMSTPEVPRKKSRNYLDSHKSIEKKRRDRINNGLTTLKDLVPNCRQYVNQGNKKLDKAEVLEMTIDYIHRLHAQSRSNGRGNIDIETSQREWINDLMSWIFQNKILYSGPGAVDAFANALLLHLQSMTSTPNPTTALMCDHQFPQDGGSASEDEGLHGSNTLLQQLAPPPPNTTTSTSSNTESAPVTTNSGVRSGGDDEGDKEETGEGGGGGGEEGANVTVSSVNQQQTQLAQLQALLLLQQQQQMFQNQQQQEGTNNVVDTHQMQQLQQLHQLQTLLLQHLTNEKQATPMQDMGGEVTETPAQSVMVTTSAMDSTSGGLGGAVFTTGEETTLHEGSQMWSQPEHPQHSVSSLLMEGEGGVVQEEVELLEQEH